MNGLSLQENIIIDMNHLSNIPKLFGTIKDQSSFQKMVGAMRNMFREHLWRNIGLNSKELVDHSAPKIRKLGNNIKLLTRIVGNFFF